MPRERVSRSFERGVVVLKFGGSVLRDEGDLPGVVHEIYRWVRRGERVIAVVSALEGTTDALIARARACADAPGSLDALHHGAYATLLATGEQTSAALLGLALDRAGVPVEVLDAPAISLETSGPTIDAFPESLDASVILRALDRAAVVVIPGFVGRDASGNTTLLGRGGSDLTALFVAAQIREALTREHATTARLPDGPAVRCTLVKDVDGLYEFDPALARSEHGLYAGAPSRYATIHWDDALRLDGGIVQHKAVRYAREHALPFRVGAALAPHATHVGEGLTTLDGANDTRVPERARVVLLGCGTVGLGVYQRLRALRHRFEVVRVVVRDIERAASSGVARSLLTTNIDDALACPCEIVIETIGGIEPARGAIERALREGRHVVTANKAVIAAHGAALEALGDHHGCSLRYAAAVGGSLPALETVTRIKASSRIREIRGVLNGTTNYVLGLVERGAAFAGAVASAQRAGFAEADPSRDLDGRDAADKLCLLAREAFGVTLDPTAIEREPLTASSVASALASLAPGEALRHVACLVHGSVDRRGPAGVGEAAHVTGSVRLESVPADSAIGSTLREWNTLIIRDADGREETVTGRGAGRWPTAEAVIADVLEATLHVRRPDLVTA
jgi:homoserine dehydrogenase